MASEKCLFYFQGDPFSKCESESEFFFHLSWELEKNKSQDNLPMFLIIFFCENTLNIFYLDTIYILCVCNREGRKKSPGKFSTLSFTKEKNHIWKWKKKTFSCFFLSFSFSFFSCFHRWNLEKWSLQNLFDKFSSYKHKRGNNFDQTWMDHSVKKKKKSSLGTLTSVSFLCFLPLDKHVR